MQDSEHGWQGGFQPPPRFIAVSRKQELANQVHDIAKVSKDVGLGAEKNDYPATQRKRPSFDVEGFGLLVQETDAEERQIRLPLPVALPAEVFAMIPFDFPKDSERLGLMGPQKDAEISVLDQLRRRVDSPAPVALDPRVATFQKLAA
jgi:hypothetical protein